MGLNKWIGCLRMNKDTSSIHRLMNAFLAVDDHLVCRLNGESRKTYIMFNGLQMHPLYLAIRVDMAILSRESEHPMLGGDRLI